MPSNAQINCANAQHSTGPNTEAGKQRSSLNALRHGLTAQTVVLPTEDPQAYQSHLKSFTDEYHPKGALESNLVQALADASWRLNRVPALEASLLAVAPDDAQNDGLAGTALLAFLERQQKAVAVLSLHSQRLSRQIEKTAAQLRELQKTRLAKEADDLDKLLDIMEMFEAKGEPTTRPTMASFLRKPKSTTPSSPATANASTTKPWNPTTRNPMSKPHASAWGYCGKPGGSRGHP